MNNSFFNYPPKLYYKIYISDLIYYEINLRNNKEFQSIRTKKKRKNSFFLCNHRLRIAPSPTKSIYFQHKILQIVRQNRNIKEIQSIVVTKKTVHFFTRAIDFGSPPAQPNALIFKIKSCQLSGSTESWRTKYFASDPT